MPVRCSFRCECGTAHAVYVHRRAFRTEVDTAGFLARPGSDIKVPIRVRNLSRTGVLFELEEAAAFDIGEELVVEFDLTSMDTTHVVKEIAVRRVVSSQVGAEFTGPGDGQDDRALQVALTQYQLQRLQ